MKAIYYRDWLNDHVPEILKEIWFERIYQKYAVTGSVVLDIGANIGLFTHYAYHFAKKIYAVEPSAQHMETMTMMLSANDMLDKVTPIQAAISNYDGTTKFFHCPNTTMFSLSEFVAPDKNDFEEVKVTSLASMFKEHNIDHVDLAKIDVEGEEMNILCHSSFDAVADKIDTIFVEYHTWTNIAPSILVSALRDRGYSVIQLPTQATVFCATRK